MPVVVLGAPAAVFADPNQQPVHSNATVAASGSAVFTGYGASEVSLFINVKAVPTGVSPTLQYTIQEVDPGDGATVIGTTVTSTSIAAAGIQRITLESAFGGSIKVSWTVGGTLPSFTQVYATLAAKQASVKIVDSSGTVAGSSANPIRTDPIGTTVQPVTAAQATAASLNATVTQGPAAALSGYWTVRVTDGTNAMPAGDAISRAVFHKLTDGTNTASVSAASALKVDGSAVTQPISAASLPLPAGASTDRTSANAPFAVRLTDGTTFYVAPSAGQLPAALVGGRLDENVGSWLGSTAPTVGQKAMSSSLPVTLASDQTAVGVKGEIELDYDSGAGVQQITVFGIALPASGGAVAGGTAANPVRTDPTGTTVQPVSGTVTANVGTTNGLALDATLTGGTAKAIVRGGAKGATAAADVTGTAEGTDHQALDVQIYHGGTAKDPTQVRALTSADVVTAAQGTAAALSGAWPAKVTDGTNTMPTMDAAARAAFQKLTDGTSVAAVKAASTASAAADPSLVVALSPNSPAQLSDGTTGPVAVKAASTSPTVSDKALVVVLSPNQQAIPVSTSPATSTPAIAVGSVVTSANTQTAVRASTYNEQSANAQRSFSSSSANDTNTAGTGARQITVTYYDSTGAGPSTEVVSLNGTTAVNSVSTTMCYIEKIVVTSVGSTGSNVGVITMFVGTAGGGGTLAAMNATDNTTFWAHHYVATGKTCYITGLSGHNTNGSNGSILVLKSKVIGASNQPEAQISDYVRVGGGTAQPVRAYNQLIKTVGPARILLYESCEGTATITTRAAFDYYDQ